MLFADKWQIELKIVVEQDVRQDFRKNVNLEQYKEIYVLRISIEKKNLLKKLG